MLHILLLILKILGFTLLGILGLILLILLTVLLVPFRYRGEVRKDDRIEVSAGVSWLLHFLHIQIKFDSELELSVKVFGIKVYPHREKPEKPVKPKKENKAQKNKDKKNIVINDNNNDKKISDESDSNTNSSDIMAEKSKQDNDAVIIDDQKSEVITENDSSAVPEKTEDRNLSDEIDLACLSEEEQSNKREKKKKRKKSKNESVESQNDLHDEIKDENKDESDRDAAFIEKMIKAVEAVIDGIGVKKDNIEKKLEEISAKLERILSIAENERVHHALRVLFKQLGKILKHIIPRRIRGNLEFGFEDPAVTGLILGVLGALYGTMVHDFTVCPDFENKVFNADCKLRGHIRLLSILFPVLLVLLVKDCRYSYKLIKKEFSSTDDEEI